MYSFYESFMNFSAKFKCGERLKNKPKDGAEGISDSIFTFLPIKGLLKFTQLPSIPWQSSFWELLILKNQLTKPEISSSQLNHKFVSWTFMYCRVEGNTFDEVSLYSKIILSLLPSSSIYIPLLFLTCGQPCDSSDPLFCWKTVKYVDFLLPIS